MKLSELMMHAQATLDAVGNVDVVVLVDDPKRGSFHFDLEPGAAGILAQPDIEVAPGAKPAHWLVLWARCVGPSNLPTHAQVAAAAKAEPVPARKPRRLGMA